MPPDTKTIIEEIPDLILDENFNESASGEFDNNLNSSTELKINLSHKEIDRIINQRFLNDTVIRYFQKLVKNVNGFEDPLLGQKLNFKECSEEFIQLLHDGRHHWMTISTLDCQPGKGKYYDSMFKGKLTESEKNQICCITRFKGKNIKIDVVPVQQQQNGFDCGVYAIAFVVSLVNKKDLTSVSFDEKKLRDHLYDCCKQGRLIPFPSAKENVKRNTAKWIYFELFCSCRMPWAKQNA